MEYPEIAAIILAAGESRRMGRPKLLLPWGGTTVLGRAAAVFAAAGVGEIVAVTGGARRAVEDEVLRLAADLSIRAVYNPEYRDGGMVGSLQAGLRTLAPPRTAALIGLGDQPQVREETVRRICEAHRETESLLVVPSFRNRRGHPWLVGSRLWDEVLALPRSATPRQFLAAHAGQVRYVEADESILQDLDTPEDYAASRK